jgi:hypothetical protein
MILRTDWAELSKINWKALIIDEAHRLKNKRSKLLERLKLFKTDHRIILTGTPLQNNTEELWTLLNFIEPHIFTSLPSFLQNFGDLKDAEQVGHLHTVLRPHLLRRLRRCSRPLLPAHLTPVRVRCVRCVCGVCGVCCVCVWCRDRKMLEWEYCSIDINAKDEEEGEQGGVEEGEIAADGDGDGGDPNEDTDTAMDTDSTGTEAEKTHTKTPPPPPRPPTQVLGRGKYKDKKLIIPATARFVDPQHTHTRLHAQSVDLCGVWLIVGALGLV